VNQRVKLKEICFESSDVHIGSNCNIEGCEFSDCNIYLEASVSTTITNCYFKDCTFIFIANCTSNIISYNRLLNVQGFKYIGKNNIIANNITL
jgi:parallel beta-helix repeat protein